MKNKQQKKHLGIWMDHASANLMDISSGAIVTKTIESDFTPLERKDKLNKGEYMMHNVEKQDQHAYYEKLGEVIKDYDEVVVFGPTHAKEELRNLLKADHHFDKIKIEVMQADKMTENQQHAFVKNYFINAGFAG